MSLKGALIAVASVVVGGIVIAGQTIGWDKFLSPIFSRPKISSLSRARPSAKTFFAGERIWLRLTGVETNRVYWLFAKCQYIDNPKVPETSITFNAFFVSLHRLLRNRKCII